MILRSEIKPIQRINFVMLHPRVLVYFLRKCQKNTSCDQVFTLHNGGKQRIDQQIFNTKLFSGTISHPQSGKLQAKLKGEKLKG